MQIILSFHKDFASEKPILEHYSRGVTWCSTCQSFTVKSNTIEKVSAQEKVYYQADTNFTLVKLREETKPALDSVSTDLIRKYARKCGDYEQAYKDCHMAGKRV